MGSDYSQPAPQSEAATLAAYQQYLPGLSSTVAQQLTPMANAQLGAAQATQTGYNQLNLDQLKQFAVPEAQIGQSVANSNALAGAKTNLDQLTGAGGDAAKAAYDLNRSTNPDYYAAQDAASSGAARAVNAINLEGLSPGEFNATERGLNNSNTQTGNLGLVNNENAVANAMNFGGAYNAKIGLLNNAVNSASGAANSAAGNGGFNGVNVALGQPNTSTSGNFGTGQFAGTNATSAAGASGNAYNFAGGLLNSATSTNNALIGANAQTGAAQIGANSPAAYLGAVCCFIFLEAYHGNIPLAVRRGRDKYYLLNKDMATGYRRVAKWLVPLMQTSNIARRLVWHLMVAPITAQLSCKGNSKVTKLITHFWLRSWAILGKGKKETDYSMTWQYPGRRTM